MASKDALKQRFVAILKEEEGYLEKKDGNLKYLYDKTANAGYNNYTKYWHEIKPSYQGQPWCACDISWAVLQTVKGDVAIAKKVLKHWPYVYCPTMADLFQLKANPSFADVVIFYRGGTFAHTGAVTYVKGDYFETQEGNTSAGHSIVPNGGGHYAKSYYNSNLPGTKFIELNWDAAKDVDLGEDITKDQYDEAMTRLWTEQNRLELDSLELAGYENKMIYNYIDDNMPFFARGIIKALVEVGALKGIDSDGRLGLSYHDLRVIATKYRSGAYDKILGVERDPVAGITQSLALKYI